jgi:hypothetical protein
MHWSSSDLIGTSRDHLFCNGCLVALRALPGSGNSSLTVLSSGGTVREPHGHRSKEQFVLI